MAHNYCKKLGMLVNIFAASDIQLKFTKSTVGNSLFNDIEDNEDDEDIKEQVNCHNEDSSVYDPKGENDEADEDDNDLGPSREEIQTFSGFDEETEFPECLEQNETNLSSDIRFVTIKDIQSRTHLVRKSWLCWFFNNHHKVSNDRLKRVQEGNDKTKTTDFESHSHIHEPAKRSIIRISDYCIFRILQKNYYLIGLVKGFANAARRNEKILLSIKITWSCQKIIKMSLEYRPCGLPLNKTVEL